MTDLPSMTDYLAAQIQGARDHRAQVEAAAAVCAQHLAAWDRLISHLETTTAPGLQQWDVDRKLPRLPDLPGPELPPLPPSPDPYTPLPATHPMGAPTGPSWPHAPADTDPAGPFRPIPEQAASQ